MKNHFHNARQHHYIQAEKEYEKYYFSWINKKTKEIEEENFVRKDWIMLAKASERDTNEEQKRFDQTQFSLMKVEGHMELLKGGRTV